MAAKSMAASLASELLASRQAIYLGRNGDSTQWASREDHLLVLGPPRCGKTSGVIIQSVAAHPGPVVVTSTRPDIQEHTLASREGVAQIGGGTVCSLAFDPDSAHLPERFSWSSNDGCSNWNTAVDRASTMAAVSVTSDKDDFFQRAARDLLAGSLHGSALANESDREMALRIQRNDLATYQEFLEWEHRDDPNHPALDVFSGLFDESQMAAETRQSVYATVRAQVLGQFMYEQGALGQPFKIEEFIGGWGTCYITVQHERVKTLRPLIAAFVEAIADRWKRSGVSRPDGTLLLALDEVANVAPIPGLPGLITTGGGDGIQVLMGLQNPGQARIWGEESEVVLRGATHVEIFGGLADTTYIQSICELVGNSMEYDIKVEVLPGVSTGPRFADAARLIEERQALEQARATSTAARRRLEGQRAAQRILRQRHRDRIVNRVADDGTESGGISQVIRELDACTRTRHEANRRLSLEPSVVHDIPVGTVLHVDRHGARWLACPGWFADEEWRDLLQQGRQ